MAASTSDRKRKRFLRYWDKHAPNYDRQMRFFESRLFGDNRTWI